MRTEDGSWLLSATIGNFDSMKWNQTMKAAVLHFNSASRDSTSPTMRIARFAADTLQVPLIHSMETARQYVDTKFDVLLVKYGMLKFSNHRDEAMQIYSQARQIINLENDYLFALDKRLRKPDLVWSTVEGRDKYVNWNVLTRMGFDIWEKKPQLPIPGNNGLIYYGAHRPDRIKSFERFFTNSPYPVTISTYRGKQFTTTCPNARVIGAFRQPNAPAAWPLTVYIEDETSHKMYCSPATRFYECISIGLAQVICEESVETFRQAYIEVPDDFIVRDKSDVARVLKNNKWRSFQKRQNLLWWENYTLQARTQLLEAWNSTFMRKGKIA